MPGSDGAAEHDDGAISDGAAPIDSSLDRDGSAKLDSGLPDAIPVDSGLPDASPHDATTEGAPPDAPVIPDAGSDSTVDDGRAPDASSSESDASGADAAPDAPGAGISDVTCTYTDSNQTITVNNVPISIASGYGSLPNCATPFASQAGYEVTIGLAPPFPDTQYNVNGPWCLASGNPLVATVPIQGSHFGESGTITLGQTDAGEQAVVAVSGFNSSIPPCNGNPSCVATRFQCSGVAPITVCNINHGGCDPNASCTPSATNTATCACNAGYSGNGQSCTSACATNNGGCDPNAICAIAPSGEETCTCNVDAGFAGDGAACAPFDPCTVNHGGCDPNATCTNPVGTAVHCTCNSGYAGNGQTCTPI